MGKTSATGETGGAGREGTEDITRFLRDQGVSPQLVDAVDDFRASACPSGQEAGRVPAPRVHYQGKEVWETALAAMVCGENLLLAGPKATGKNVLAQDLAYVLGRPEWDVSFHIDMDASYMIGSDTYADGRVTFRPGPIVRCAQVGGLCVLDEINMARSEALAVLHATLDFRRIIDVPGYDLVRLDPACRFVATMNVGYEGTRELNQALASRFAVIDMPVLDEEGTAGLLAQEFGDLTPAVARQLAKLFGELRAKCAHGELSDRALDLRGLMDAVRLVRAGLDARAALEACLANKTFDAYEQQIVRDLIAARIPRDWDRGQIFGC